MESRKLDTSDSSPEIKSIEDIKQHGTKIGKGKYGTVYRIDNQAYKIYFLRDRGYDPAKRSARYWNQVYSEIHYKKFKHLACATSKILPDKDGQIYNVLITPFIDQQDLNFHFDFEELSEQTKSFLPKPLKMIDAMSPGNIKETKRGEMLPVDFDQVYPEPTAHIKERCCGLFDTTTYSYESPPSPVTKYFAIREYAGKEVNYNLKKTSPSLDTHEHSNLIGDDVELCPASRRFGSGS